MAIIGYARGFGALVVAQLALAAEFDTGGHSALTSFASTFANKLPLELSDGGQERREQAALCR
jgi:hypothetical protein